MAVLLLPLKNLKISGQIHIWPLTSVLWHPPTSAAAVSINPGLFTSIFSVNECEYLKPTGAEGLFKIRSAKKNQTRTASASTTPERQNPGYLRPEELKRCRETIKSVSDAPWTDPTFHSYFQGKRTWSQLVQNQHCEDEEDEGDGGDGVGRGALLKVLFRKWLRSERTELQRHLWRVNALFGTLR